MDYTWANNQQRWYKGNLLASRHREETNRFSRQCGGHVPRPTGGGWSVRWIDSRRGILHDVAWHQRIASIWIPLHHIFYPCGFWGKLGSHCASIPGPQTFHFQHQSRILKVLHKELGHLRIVMGMLQAVQLRQGPESLETQHGWAAHEGW